MRIAQTYMLNKFFLLRKNKLFGYLKKYALPAHSCLAARTSYKASCLLTIMTALEACSLVIDQKHN